MTPPVLNPALVSRDAATRLPRTALLLLSAAYVLPGLFGRDPWRGADLNSFGLMLALAQGRSDWLAPTLGGMPSDAAVLPHWIGAAAIMAGSPWIDAAVAARLPFAAMLAGTLAAVWYATFHLARSASAQPLPFAFGGEASTVDYARTIADGALLAAIATLGLLQLGHETTPELAQLAAMAAFQWALAAHAHQAAAARWGVLLSLPALAACGAPTMALALGTGAALLSLKRPDILSRRFLPGLMTAMAVAALASWSLNAWAWRISQNVDPAQLLRLWAWFLWPTWVFAGWTLWRWRRQLLEPHLSIPLLGLLVALVACIVMGGWDRALMLGVPGIAVLAAFSLPTFGRSASAAIDWFSVFFFSACGIAVWVVYASLQTGVPAKPAANVARLAQGYAASMSWPLLIIAATASLAWVWLVRWRTGRHRPAIWKSLVLPASGVALCWLLLMTLLLPVLDYARSQRPLIERLKPHLSGARCVAAPGANMSLISALEFHAAVQVDAGPRALSGPCDVLVLVARGAAPRPPKGWRQVALVRRPTERNEITLVYRR